MTRRVRMLTAVPTITRFLLFALLAIAVVDVVLLLTQWGGTASSGFRTKSLTAFGLIVVPVVLSAAGMLMINDSRLSQIVLVIEVTASIFATLAYLESPPMDRGWNVVINSVVYWIGALLAVLSGTLTYVLRIRIRINR